MPEHVGPSLLAKARLTKYDAHAWQDSGRWQLSGGCIINASWLRGRYSSGLVKTCSAHYQAKLVNLSSKFAVYGRPDAARPTGKGGRRVSPDIETVEVHYLYPCGHEIPDKLLLGVGVGVGAEPARSCLLRMKSNWPR
jgi:hypothetical protein